MDGLSAASGVIAVVQIAVQLGQGINQIYVVLPRAISDAPKEIHSVVQELEFFDSILNQIRRNQETSGSQIETYLALERCDASLKALLSIAESLVHGLSSSSRTKRKWAAVEVVRKNDEISKFKAKLQEAKLDLLIAQQTSEAQAQNIRHQTHQESLIRLTELCERLSFSSSTITPLTTESTAIPEQVSSDIRQAASFCGTNFIQSGLETQLRQMVQNTFTSVLTEQNEKHALSGIDNLLDPGVRLVRSHSGRRALNTTSRVTRTILGEMYCSVTTFRTGRISSDTDADDEATEKFEIETRFSLVPSWWVVKFGMTKVFNFDIVQLGSQGWQAKMTTFNRVPSDSPIFDFCREGNLDAVRSLLKHGKASARDITAEGLTPLHAAASRCEAGICALLLREGADSSAREYSSFNMTPFESACCPGDIGDCGRELTYTRVHSQNLDQTIRQFLKLYDCFDDALQERVIRELISSEGEGIFTDLTQKTPSMWLLYEIIPNINPYIVDREFWQACLESTITTKQDHCTTEALMSHCDQDMIRTAFLVWAQNIVGGWFLNSTMPSVRDFNLLRERSGGLHFAHRRRWGNGDTSILSIVMEMSWSFATFRTLLDEAGIDRKKFIEDQIASFDDGWTAERLSAVFDDQYSVAPVRSFRCGHCRKYTRYRDGIQVPWARRLRRFKNGIDPDATLDEAELKDQQEWEEFLVACENSLCSTCQLKGIKSKKELWMIEED